MMSPLRFRVVSSIVGIACLLARGASAQSAFAYGIIGGAASLRDSGSMQAMSVLLEYKPMPWLTLSANPSFDRVTVQPSTGGSTSSSGLTDLPVGVAASHELPDAPLSPTVGAGIELSLPLGNSSNGLGSGQTSVAGDLGLGVSPTDNVSLDLNVWHPFTGAGVNSVLDASRATSLGLEGGYDWSERLTTSVGYSADVGPADSGVARPQSIAAGFVLAFAKPLALTVDGAHGVTNGAPRWLVSVGIGTAFSGVNPVGPNSLLGRLKHAFGRSANRGHGQGKLARKTK